MTDFVFKTRNLTEEPLRCDLYDNDGETYYGAVWVKFRDPYSASYEALRKRRFDKLAKDKAEHTRLTKPRTDKDHRDSKEFMVRFFVEDYVTDSQLEAEDGKQKYVHDNETLIRFFMALPMAYDECINAAYNVANFRKEKEEDAKNV